MLVYSDSVILVYFFDHTGPFHSRAVLRMSALRTAGELVAISPVWSAGLKPIRLGNAAALE